VPLNCGAIPEAMIESERFGCERGAFTDARQARSGLVSAAAGGPRFLDELDAMPSHSQVALLRFLQDHRDRPVGGTRERTGDICVVAAGQAGIRIYPPSRFEIASRRPIECRGAATAPYHDFFLPRRPSRRGQRVRKPEKCP
jgi:hypothetical protein